MNIFENILVFILTFIVNVLLYSYVFAGINIFLACILMIIIDLLIWFITDYLFDEF